MVEHRRFHAWPLIAALLGSAPPTGGKHRAQRIAGQTGGRRPRFRRPGVVYAGPQRNLFRIPLGVFLHKRTHQRAEKQLRMLRESLGSQAVHRERRETLRREARHG